MTRAVHALFETEIARLARMLGDRPDHARFVFDDLAGDAAHACRTHNAPFCLALRAAVIAFELEFAQSQDALLAHTAACARLDVMAMLARGSK